MKRLLAIIEMGGYANFLPLYRSLGFTPHVENSMRKARTYLKKERVDVIVAEYNFQSQFRDRTSNLETLMAILEKHGEAKVIVFYPTDTAHKLAQLEQRFPLHAALPFPLSENALREVLESLDAGAE